MNKQQKKKEENRISYNNDEFFTPRSNLSSTAVDRNTAFNKIHSYINEYRNDLTEETKIIALKSTIHRIENKEKISYDKKEFNRKLYNFTHIQEKQKLKDSSSRNIEETLYKHEKNIRSEKHHGYNIPKEKIYEKVTNKVVKKKRTFSESSEILKVVRHNEKHFQEKEKYHYAPKQQNEQYMGTFKRHKWNRNDYRKWQKEDIIKWDTPISNDNNISQIVLRKKEVQQLDTYNKKYCNAYLEMLYLRSKKFFLVDKMLFSSSLLFYKNQNIHNLIFLIDSLYLKRKYIELLNLLNKHKNLWISRMEKNENEKEKEKEKEEKKKKKKNLDN